MPAFGSNFEVLRLVEDGVLVSGSSAPLGEDGLELTRRDVVVTQGDCVARGSIGLGLKWSGTLPTQDRFTAGQPATAVGTESYGVTAEAFVESASATFTWTQALKLEQ
jgi:hypothetical protein